MELTYFSRSGSLTLGRHSTSQQQGDATLLIKHSTNNLKQVGFDNTMSRYKIDSDETWLFYDQPNFEGLLFTATGPIDWTRVDPQYNDKVSSVRIVKEGEWGKIRLSSKKPVCLFANIIKPLLSLHSLNFIYGTP